MEIKYRCIIRTSKYNIYYGTSLVLYSILSVRFFPKVLLNIGPYDCRAKADAVNVAVSQKPFFNATKQDRYNIKDGSPRNLR